MTATPDIIPTDLTLEIGENLSPERFMAAARAFFGYVHEISQSLAPEGNLPRWTVMVREGSSLLAVEPGANVPNEVAQAIYSRAENGIRRLADGDIDESGLPDAALKHLRTLSELSEETQHTPNPIRFWVRKKPINVDPAIGHVIREDSRSDYNDYGTIEGRLETIHDNNGSLQLQIRDVMLKHKVRCYFPEELLMEMFSKVRKRVEISGTIHYRKNGAPISIDVSRIDSLPEDSELPTAEDVRGILRVN